MAELYTRFDGVFFEKTRLSIVTLLNQDERLAFNALKDRLELSDGSLYTHLEKLVGSGYVKKERELGANGSRTLYELTPRGREIFADYIAFLDDILGRGEG
jgi:DNA-binding MarR family transcriptional regulator